MDILIIILLLIAGIVFLCIELFIVPGISISGLLAGACIIYANYYAFANMGPLAGWLTLLASAVACIGSVIWFMRSKTLDRISLKKNITGTVDRSAEATVRVGDVGMTTTRLALIGYADIKGYIVEVKADGEFIDEKTPIEVVRIMNGTLLVRKITNNNP
ncbi:MAG: nodulation efficiency protein D (NfeD) [Bacteroides sp.]|nr:nodulation efficiency protein D (NfeD) [Bacteroides sp.]